MFDQLKQLNQLRKIKESLEKERKTVEKQGVSVTANGKMEIEDVKLNPDIDTVTQEDLIKECFNEAVREIQKEAAQKMFNM
jgi:DNA-binding protein YbaB